MRVLITAGPTHEPIDPVRYIGNRSSGKMGAALAQAALDAGHEVTLITGPGVVPMPRAARRIDIQTARELHSALLHEGQTCDLLIMAAAVADYSPKLVSATKLSREGSLTIACVATPDILHDFVEQKRANQRVVGFSLESDGGIERAKKKMLRKGVDLMVFNEMETVGSDSVSAVLLSRDKPAFAVPSMTKPEFAALLLDRSVEMFG